MIPGPERSPGEEIGYTLQYSWASLVAPTCNVGDLGLIPGLEKGMATHSRVLAWKIPMDRGAWWATVHGVAKSRTQLHDKAQYSTTQLPFQLNASSLVWGGCYNLDPRYFRLVLKWDQGTSKTFKDVEVKYL